MIRNNYFSLKKATLEIPFRRQIGGVISSNLIRDINSDHPLLILQIRFDY